MTERDDREDLRLLAVLYDGEGDEGALDPEARERLEGWKQVRSVLKEQDDRESLRPEFQVRLRSAVHDALDEPSGWAGWRRWLLGGGGAVLATAAAAALVLMVVEPQEPVDRPVASLPLSDFEGGAATGMDAEARSDVTERRSAAAAPPPSAASAAEEGEKDAPVAKKEDAVASMKSVPKIPRRLEPEPKRAKKRKAKPRSPAAVELAEPEPAPVTVPARPQLPGDDMDVALGDSMGSSETPMESSMLDEAVPDAEREKNRVVGGVGTLRTVPAAERSPSGGGAAASKGSAPAPAPRSKTAESSAPRQGAGRKVGPALDAKDSALNRLLVEATRQRARKQYVAAERTLAKAERQTRTEAQRQRVRLAYAQLELDRDRRDAAEVWLRRVLSSNVPDGKPEARRLLERIRREPDPESP